jgi:hypothetical protein
MLGIRICKQGPIEKFLYIEQRGFDQAGVVGKVFLEFGEP